MFDKLKNILNRDKSVTGFKHIGDGVWFAVWSNNFKDLEGEILSQDAHDRYLSRVEAGIVPMPELWLWHVPGSRIGQAKMLWREGHMMVGVGEFDDTPQGQEAQKYFKASDAYEMSHGFTYKTWDLKDGVYSDYNTFEISVLPKGRAANPFTTFEEIRTMGMTDEQKTWLEATFPNHAKALLESAERVEEAGKQLAATGAAYKDYADATPEAAETEAEKSATDEGMATLLNDILSTQNDLMELVDDQAKALNGMTATLADIRKENEQLKQDLTEKNEKAVADLEKVASELQTRLDEKPQSVDSSEKNVVPDADVAQVEEERKAAEFVPDPALMGADIAPSN